MRRRALIERITPFPRDAGGYLIDDLKLFLHAGIPSLHWRRPDSLALKSVRHGEVRRVKGVPALVWREPDDLACTQFLGRGPGGRGSRTRWLNWNPIRAVRVVLEREGSLRPHPETRSHELNSILETEADLALVRRRMLSLLVDRIRDARESFATDYALLFATPISPLDVRVGLGGFELAWDRPCLIAKLVSKLAWDAWRIEVPGAYLRAGLLSGDEQPYAKGRASGVGYKLYGKRANLLRYEAQVSGKGVQRLIGRSICFADIKSLVADLDELAAKVYQPILDTQDSLNAPCGYLPIWELVCSVLPPRQARSALRIWTALLADGVVRRDPKDKAEHATLQRLARAGLVRYGRAGKGLWSATARLNGSLVVHETVARVLAGRRG